MNAKPTAKRLTLPRSQHLRRPEDFARLYGLRQRTGDAHLLVFAASNNLDTTRIGLSVSKKHGNAVQRNRLKRLLREAFRLEQHQLPAGLDLILIPRENSAATLEDYRRSLVALAGRLERRLKQRGRMDDRATERQRDGEMRSR